MKYKLVFKFSSKEEREIFLSWLCDAGGEQDYWNSCEMKPDERPAVTFNYHNNDGEFVGYLNDATVVVETEPYPL